MDSNSQRLVEMSIIIIDLNMAETEVILGIGIPRNDRCCVYLDGFDEPRCRSGLNNWNAFFGALRWLAVRLQILEERGYKFATTSCEPPRLQTALELVDGMSFIRLSSD